MLKPELARGNLSIIGMSTATEYDNAFAGTKHFLKDLPELITLKADKAKSIDAMKGWLTKAKKPVPSEEVLNKIYQFSSEYNPVGAQPRKSILLLEDVYANLKTEQRFGAPLGADVEKATMSLYGVDPAYFDPELMKTKVNALPSFLDESIIGQQSAKTSVVKSVRRGFAGMSNPEKPLGIELWVGPPGTGKTELGQTLADGLSVPFKRIEMNQYGNRAPQDLLREVAEAIRKNPYSVIMLDEFEKAPLEVQNALLAAFDKGMFTVQEKIGVTNLTQSIRVSARKARFVITTNALNSNLGNVSDKELRDALVNNGISEPIVDRVDNIAQFQIPTREDFKKLVTIKLDKELKTQSERHGFEFNFKDREKFIDAVTNKYFEPGMSNRNVPRIIAKEVQEALTDAKFKGILEPGNKVDINYKSGVESENCLLITLRKLIK